MTDYGTIKIPREEYEQHNEKRQELGLTWQQYLNEVEPPEPEWLQSIRNDGEVTYDDVKQACKKAIREELPVGEL